MELVLVVCGRVCAMLRFWPADVALAYCCQLWVRSLRWSQEVIYTCCVQRRFVANRNFLGAVGLVPRASRIHLRCLQFSETEYVHGFWGLHIQVCCLGWNLAVPKEWRHVSEALFLVDVGSSQETRFIWQGISSASSLRLRQIWDAKCPVGENPSEGVWTMDLT